MISENKYRAMSALFAVPAAAIKAVAEVESRGGGFLPDGAPVILFEPHIFWQQLKDRGIAPMDHVCGNEDILYPDWRPGKYGPASQQHARLARAAEIHREAALASASWGKFQIMGFNWKACGCASLQEFINRVYQSEDEHLELFMNFIKNKGLIKHLQEKKWDRFALGYNGAGYKKNKYDTKLAAAFAKHAK